MFAILAMGFFLGLQHAMEADHIAAVAAISAGRRKFSRILRHGLFWGLGHALALSAFAGAVVMARGQVPAEVGGVLEFTVGLMLIALGAMVIWRLIEQRMHFHAHRHHNGSAHFHMHNHIGESQAHDENNHQHGHARHGTRRSLFVGIMHGLAGSAALVALATPDQLGQGIGFVLLFGVGSIAGMVLITSVIALPLALTGKLMTGLNRTLQASIGLVSIALGCYYAYHQAPLILHMLEII